MISEMEFEQAMQQKINFVYNPSAGKETKTSTQSYFVDEVVKSVIKDLSEQKALVLKLQKIWFIILVLVYTTLEPKVQNALDEVFTDDTFSPMLTRRQKGVKKFHKQLWL